MEQGQVLTGQFVEDKTGLPIPNAKVRAMAHYPRPKNESFMYHAESLTDDEGKFRFSNLGDGPYNLYANDPPRTKHPAYSPGEENIVLRQVIPE